MLERVDLGRIEGRGNCLVKVFVDVGNLGFLFRIVGCHQVEHIAVLVVVIHLNGFVKIGVLADNLSVGSVCQASLKHLPLENRFVAVFHTVSNRAGKQVNVATD